MILSLAAMERMLLDEKLNETIFVFWWIIAKLNFATDLLFDVCIIWIDYESEVYAIKLPSSFILIIIESWFFYSDNYCF